ncbi:MAG TPA: hypothetical protein VJ912_01955 [Candidatus Nanoarchaeia archaeon]|nr:hypothetical protein [Candidatus Nanoarchaeia archaeon]
MAKGKTREVSIKQSKGSFFFGKSGKGKYDFDNLSSMRKILSNEKAKILHVIKTEQPSSIYDLAKKLGRGFKSVRDDLKILEKFGFIEYVREKTKKRTRYRPVVSVETLTINFRV